jgi:hypothetical protein
MSKPATPKLPKAIRENFLLIGEKKLPCAVLEDGTSILSRNAVFRAFGRTKRGRSKLEVREPNMPSFADAKNLKPFIDNEFPGGLTTITYLSLKGVETQGYKAEVLPSMCEVYLKALEAEVLTGPQKELAKVATSLIRIFAKIGIVAWIHEVTGYQYIRDPSALSALVALYIADEKRKWQCEFRDEFYTHLGRIYGRSMVNPKQRPQWMAKFTTKYIYEPLEEGEVLRQLDKVNPVGPKGYRKDKLHSHTSADYGILRVRERIEGTLTCLKIATNKRKFDSLYARAFPSKEGYQADWIDDQEI